MKRRGLTLLEVLVVIGVLGVVFAVGLRCSFNARENALDVQCKSNLRQLARLCTAYALETGEFPWGMNVVEGYSSYCWDFVKRTDSANREPGVMWGDCKLESVVSCPKCRHESDNWDGSGYTGYNYNCAYVGKVKGDAGARKKPLKWSAVKRPDRLLLFGDAGYSGGMNKFMRAPVSVPLYDSSPAGLRESGTQAFRHLGHANLSFADGRVESCATPYTLGGKKGFVDKRTRTAFAGADNGIYGEDALKE